MNSAFCSYDMIYLKSGLLAFLLLLFLAARAQVGKVGINTDAPDAMLHVKDSSVLFSGIIPLPGVPGLPPASGAGTRMMWYADKAAFRAGNVDGTQWNKDSIGLYSIALGQNVKAKGKWSLAIGFQTNSSGIASTAIGNTNTASGNISIALGSETIASGIQSTAMGTNTEASGDFSTATGGNSIASGYVSTATGHTTEASGYAAMAMGYVTTASGERATAMGSYTVASGAFSTAMGAGTKAEGTSSTAMGAGTKAEGANSTSMGLNTKAIGAETTSMGFNTIARPFASLVIGRYNDTTSISSTNWDISDPVFVIGNGSSNTDRTNAFTILKSGKTGINNVSPDAMLHVIKDIPTGGPYNANAAAIFEGDQGSFIQLSNSSAIQSGILSGNEFTSLRSALIFSPDSSVQIRTGGNNTRFVVRNDGRTGIGDLSPNARLHISEGSGGLLYHNEADMILEDNSSSYLQFSTLTSGESGILSGNEVTSIRSGLIFTADSSVQLLAGGNTKLTLEQNGNMGVGTNNPQKLLHIRKNSSGATPTTSAIAVLESNTDVSLNLLAPDAESSAIYFGNPTNAVHGGIVYNSPSVNGIAFRTNGNVTRAVISDTGDVGIGDNTPDAKLDVNGTVILGANGTSITEIIKVTVLSDVPNVVAGGTVTETIPVANSNTTSSVSISPATALQNGLIMAYARVSVAGTVEVKFTNTTGADINPPPMNFYITVIR